MPATSRLRELYLGKSITDLETHYNIDSIVKGRKSEHLCTTAKKLLDKAVADNKRGDEESSFVHYMKFLSVITAVQKIEGKQLPPTLMIIIGGKESVNGALAKAEELKISLCNRYKLISEKATVDATLIQKELNDAAAEIKKRLQPQDLELSNGIASLAISDDDVSLTCQRLYAIQNSKKLRVLIIDARPALCFSKSHMTYDNCISIPEAIIEAGTSAGAMEKNMPAESRVVFGQRRSFDLVVMLDWDTTQTKFTPGSKLYILRSILLKWDPGVIYPNTPLILRGGYTEWLLTYPTLTTDPSASPPEDDVLDDLLLDNVEYPSFETDGPGGRRPTTAPDSRPGVDRGSKAAAIQTYDERHRTLTELLEASDKGMDDSLKLETNRLKAEHEWEELRLKKEKEADDEMRQYFHNQQDELLVNISRLEESQRKTEEENQSLRKQLEEIRRRDSAPVADRSTKSRDQDAKAREREARIKKHIEDTEEQTRLIARQREEATRERLRQVEIERAKRKEEEARRLAKRSEQQKPEGSYTVKLNDSASSSMMKRSHSSPNIAQLMEGQDAVAIRGKVPAYNRSMKPLNASAKRFELYAARTRNFSPVHGSVPQGLTGLKNLGNSCYMNSIIQCINNTSPIFRYFCFGEHRNDLNFDSETRGEIAEEMATVIRALWSGHYRSIACRDLKETVGQHKQEFRGTQQQDSHEFLFYLIDWLHNDLNKRSAMAKIPAEKPPKDMNEAQKQWHEFERCNSSIFQQLFFGQQKSTVQCLRCGNESVTYETFNHLTLPLPSNNINRCALSECMKLYLSGDRISGWKCTNCKDLREATKKFDITKLPKILVIHFKRFQHDGWSSKIQTHVEFPLCDLEMTKYGISVPAQQLYQLYGVSNHYGTIDGGHYTAYCKNSVLEKWYKFDDLEVKEISPSDVRTGAAYILFYSSVV